VQPATPDEGRSFYAPWNAVGAGYFEAMGIGLLQGRSFTTTESYSRGAPPVVILDETMAARLWPEADRPAQRLAWLLRRTWYIHRFRAPDADRDLHDHPWDARGRILAGAYAEVYQDGPERLWRVLREGDKTHIRPDHYHRISNLLRSVDGDPAEVWTLLRCGTYVKSWGYLVRGLHVHWREYHEAGDRPAPLRRAGGRRA
jgi:hypothetical protein